MIRDLPEVAPGYYFGQPGRLFALPEIVGSLKVAPSRGVTTRRTIAGRVNARRGQRVRRVWECSIPVMTPSELGMLELAEREVGAWITPDAAHINVLTYEQSLLDPVFNYVTHTGLSQVEPGVWVPSASVNQSIVLVAQDVPFIPGGVFTVSAWMQSRGDIAIGLRQRGETGADRWVGAAANGWERKFWATTIPATWTTGLLEITLRGLTAFAGLAVSWTPGVREWGTGRGCAQAVMQLGDQDLRRTDPTVTNAAFTVTELG